MTKFIGMLNSQAEERDVKSLSHWLYDRCEIEGLKKRIARHNRIPEIIYGEIDDQEFEKWVNSLGWKRR